mmetsp:Transcript_11074/g.13841  ORF Transcript_11074/g.13841 Transcript_11074/m.13841 type:complete len:107 (+) Transcript_11074:259-579(+)
MKDWSWLEVCVALTLTVFAGIITLAEMLEHQHKPVPESTSDSGEETGGSDIGKGKKKEKRIAKVNFVPTNEWQPVEEHHILPPGLEIRMNLQTGQNYARRCSSNND